MQQSGQPGAFPTALFELYGAASEGYTVTSVFDICWYTFGRLAADFAPPMDTGFDDEYPQGSILHCLACGSLFLRRSSRQRYCQSADCQAERNRRNRRASYARHRNDGKDSATEE